METAAATKKQKRKRGIFSEEDEDMQSETAGTAAVSEGLAKAAAHTAAHGLQADIADSAAAGKDPGTATASATADKSQTELANEGEVKKKKKRQLSDVASPDDEQKLQKKEKKRKKKERQSLGASPDAASPAGMVESAGEADKGTAEKMRSPFAASSAQQASHGERKHKQQQATTSCNMWFNSCCGQEL